MSDNAKYTHIFIAYASQDQAAHDTLLSHLNLLQKEIPITIWSEADLMPGAEIQKETQAKLQDADIVLLLVSTDLLNSQAYTNIQSQVQASATFVPVLVRPCMWDSDPFLNKLQVLPKSKQAISLANHQEKVYTEIAGDIKKMVVGKVEDAPLATPINKPIWRKMAVAALVAVLALVGFRWFSSSSDKKVEPPTAITVVDTPNTPDTFISAYGTPIFTPSDTFSILILRFEDYITDKDTDCIGLAIKKLLIDIRTKKGLLIHPVYADNILSLEYVEQAISIQEYHNADLLIHGLANQIQPECTGANVCFRHVIANTIMANIDDSDDIEKTKHDLSYEKTSPFDIEQGRLSVDEQNMENWITGLVALKKGDKETYFEKIEKMAKDIAHLTKEEQASRFYNQGDVYYSSGDYKKAIASYTKAIELKPDYAEAYGSRGISHRKLKEYKSAILDYGKAIELKPDDIKAYNNRGNSYYYLKEYKSAILDFDKAIQLKPDYAEAYNNRGISYAKLKEYKSAILDYDKAIQLKPDYAEAYYNRGISYDNLKEYKSAILDYDKAIQLKPDLAEAYYNRGISYNNLKEHKSAILDYDKAIQLKPDDAEAYYNRGNSYDDLKDYKKAILDYDKAIQLKPDYAKAYNNRGGSYFNFKEYKNAILDYDKAIQLKPDLAEVYYNRGSSYDNLKDYKKAILDYDKAIQLKPDYAKAYNNRGNSYAYLKEYKSAILDYDKAIQLKPDYAYAYIGRASTHIYLGNFEKAITDAKKAIKLDPHPYGYFNLIAAYALNNLILIIFSLIFIIASFIAWRKYRKSKK